MVRIRDISDPALRRHVIEAIARRQGVRPEEIPHWFELDDSTYDRLRQELKADDGSAAEAGT